MSFSVDTHETDIVMFGAVDPQQNIRIKNK